MLYVRETVRDRLGPVPFVDGRSAEWHDDDTWSPHRGSAAFEFGEQFYAGKAGLAVATRYALDIGLGAIEARISALAERLRELLAGVDGVVVRDQGRRRCGIVTFTHERHDSTTVGAALAAARVNVSVPGRRNAQWDLGSRGIADVVRAGLHAFNTDAEIERLVDVVADLD